MEYVRVGKSGLKVSPICLGTMMFGGQTDEAAAEAIVASARDAGINFIDTADIYNAGKSEAITGRLIERDRDRWVLATKACNAMADGPNGRGLSRKWLVRAADESLRRLRTDYIDIWYFHKEDHTVEAEESLRTVNDLIRGGKIRYFGLSNFPAWRVAAICGICDRLGMERPISTQVYYNAMNRMPEREQLVACDHYGIGAIAYSPLARGVLTGKYHPDLPPPADTRAGRNDRRMMQAEWRRESLIAAQTVKAHAERKGITPGQFAVAWVINNKLVTATIAGPRTLTQWQEYLGAPSYKFESDDEDLIDSLVVTGHPSTPGYNDPNFPFFGRQPRYGTRTSTQ